MTYMLHPDKLESFMSKHDGVAHVVELAKLLRATETLVRHWAHDNDVSREGTAYVFNLKEALALQEMLRLRENPEEPDAEEAEEPATEEPKQGILSKPTLEEPAPPAEPATDDHASLWDEAFETIDELRRRHHGASKHWDRLTELLTQLKTP